MTIRIPAKGPTPELMDVNVQPILERAADSLLKQLSEMVDSGIAPSGELIPNRDQDTVERRLRAGSSTPGHRTGTTRRRWRRRQIKKGKRTGNIIVELTPINGYRNQLSRILAGADFTPGEKLMGTVNNQIDVALPESVEFRGTDGAMRPARRGK